MPLKVNWKHWKYGLRTNFIGMSRDIHASIYDAMPILLTLSWVTSTTLSLSFIKRLIFFKMRSTSGWDKSISGISLEVIESSLQKRKKQRTFRIRASYSELHTRNGSWLHSPVDTSIESHRINNLAISAILLVTWKHRGK